MQYLLKSVPLVPGNMEANFARFMALHDVKAHQFKDEFMLQQLRQRYTEFLITPNEPRENELAAEWVEIGAGTMRMAAFLYRREHAHGLLGGFDVGEADRDDARVFFDQQIISDALSPICSKHLNLERFMRQCGATVELRKQ